MTQPINLHGVHAYVFFTHLGACSTGSALGTAQPGVPHCCKQWLIQGGSRGANEPHFSSQNDINYMRLLARL